jgi:hypothetical protein
LAQPSPGHPLVVLEIGDSLGEDLGLGMGSVLGSDTYVDVLQKAVGFTGLARPDYYNWPGNLEAELHEYHPGAVVIMLGGNDGQNFYDGSRYVAWGSALWHEVYSQRVGLMMDEAVSAGAHVLWVGMPICQDPGFSAEMGEQDSVYEQQAALHPGVTYYSSWDLFEDSAGQYSAYLPGSSGQDVLVRDPDGVHLAGGGEVRLASAIVPVMDSAWGINLHV